MSIINTLLDTDFYKLTMNDKDKELFENLRRSKMELTEKDSEIFAKTLLDDNKPTEEAKEAAKKYMNSKYLTSECWYRFLDNVEIIDPDGWDRGNFQHSWYEEKISFEEFYNRLIKSTIKWKE